MNFISKIFEKAPGSNFGFYTPMLILIALLICGGIVFGQIYKNRKKHDFAFKRLFKKTAKRLVLIGLLLGLLTLIRYENIPYFSMRIWLYLSFFLLAWFTYSTIKTFKIEYPKEKENVSRNIHSATQKKEEKKYLPHKKRR